MKQKKSPKLRGSWYTVNIKAFEEQNKQHYVDALISLIQKDPLVKLQGNRHISVEGYDFVGTEDNMKMILLRLCAYDLLDPDAFYDIRKKEEVRLDISPDIVSNKKSGVVYIVPDVHRLMIHKSSNITLIQVVKYLTIGFDMIGRDGEFDITVEVSSEVIDTIEKSYIRQFGIRNSKTA